MNSKIEEKSKKKTNYVQWIAPLVLLLIAGPFIYFSILVNKYATLHQPEGFNFPHITDFWKSAAGAVVAQVSKMILIKGLRGPMYSIVKISDDEDYRQKHVRKGAEYFYCAI